MHKNMLFITAYYLSYEPSYSSMVLYHFHMYYFPYESQFGPSTYVYMFPNTSEILSSYMICIEIDFGWGNDNIKKYINTKLII